MTTKLTMPTKWIPWLLILFFTVALAACASPEERARAHYQSGQELLQAGEFVKAGLEFRNALKYNDKIAEAWFGLATVEEKKAAGRELNEATAAVGDALQAKLAEFHHQALCGLCHLPNTGLGCESFSGLSVDRSMGFGDEFLERYGVSDHLAACC